MHDRVGKRTRGVSPRARVMGSLVEILGDFVPKKALRSKAITEGVARCAQPLDVLRAWATRTATSTSR